MAFKIVLLPSAQMDIEEAINFYNQINISLARRFHAEFNDSLTLLTQNPFFEIKYETIRTVRLKSFPYRIHFHVNENTGIVSVFGVIFGGSKNLTFGYRLPM